MPPLPINPRQLIGLTGAHGAGKDTVAEAMAALGYSRIALSDALRAELAAAFRVDLRLFTDRVTKELPLPSLAIGMCTEPAFLAWAVSQELDILAPRSPRWLMQRWGTEFRQGQDPNYWTMIVVQWIGRQHGRARHRVVVSDVSLPNHAAMVHALCGWVVRVHRPGSPELAADTSIHPSSRPLPCDAVLHNDGDMDHLRAEMVRVVRRLFYKEAAPL